VCVCVACYSTNLTYEDNYLEQTKLFSAVTVLHST
jgi:hypothetical protein